MCSPGQAKVDCTGPTHGSAPTQTLVFQSEPDTAEKHPYENCELITEN